MQSRAQEKTMSLFGKKKDEDNRETERIRDGEDQKHLELREEELRVEKERVQAGEVRLRKEVVTEKKTLEVPVTHEEVVVERHSVGGNRAASGDIGEDSEIRIPLTEEQVRVEKTPVVREEVSLKKQQVQDTQRVSETVKREEAWVDSTGDARVAMNSGGAWQGSERRRHTDQQYRGVDRRVGSSR
jgi:uncharacterized protein (TIGR02271 family)